MDGFIISKDGKPTSGKLFPNITDAEEALVELRNEWPGQYDGHKVITARITTEPTPDEIKSAIHALVDAQIAGRIGASERVTRQAELHNMARAAIRDWVRVLPSTPAIEFLRLAIGGGSSPENDLLSSIKEVLDLTDPEDADGAFDCAHKALREYQETFWADGRMAAE